MWPAEQKPAVFTKFWFAREAVETERLVETSLKKFKATYISIRES